MKISISLKEKFLSELLKILGGNVIGQGLVFISGVLVANNLGPDRYGVFTIAVSVFTILLQISDVGTSTSYIRYFSSKDTSDSTALSSVLIAKFCIAICISAILFFMAPFFADLFFQNVSQVYIFFGIAILLPVQTLYTAFIAHLQAKQRFAEYSIVNILHGMAKLGIAALLPYFFISPSALHFFLAIYSLAIIFIAVFAFKYLSEFKFHLDFIANLFKLGGWVLTSTIAAAVLMQVDVFLLGKFHSEKEAGIFSAALSTAMVIPLLTTALSTTLLPKVGAYLEQKTPIEYAMVILKQWYWVVFFLIGLQVLAPVLIVSIFNPEFSEMLVPFRILLVAFSLGVLVNPISLVYYFTSKARYLTLMNWLQLGLTLVLSMALIPDFGAVGAAWSALGVRIFGFVFVIGFLLYWERYGY